jgi:uncharacterized protein with PQ loop repeat
MERKLKLLILASLFLFSLTPMLIALNNFETINIFATKDTSDSKIVSTSYQKIFIPLLLITVISYILFLVCAFKTNLKVELKKKHYFSKASKSIDKIIIGVGALGFIATAPQAIKIFLVQDATGVSLFTWSTNFILASIWVTYGSIHKYKPIIIAYALYMVAHIGILAGIYLYG